MERVKRNNQFLDDLPRDKRGYIDWRSIYQKSPDELIKTIEEKVQVIFTNKNDFSYHDLEKSGYSSISNAIKKYYPSGLIGLREKFIRDDKLIHLPKEGFVIRDNQKWAPLGYYSQKLNISLPTLQNILSSSRKINGRVPQGAKTNLYSEADVLNIAADFIDKPMVSKELETYIDEDGEWVTVNTLRKKYNISTTTLRSLLNRSSYLSGKSAHGRSSYLYNLKEAELILDKIDNKPKTEKVSNTLSENDGKRWVSQGFLAEKFKMANATVASLISSCDSKEGRDSYGHQVMLFDLDQAIIMIKGFTDLPMINESDGIYTDQSGDLWVTRFYLKQRFNVSKQLKAINGCPKIRGRDKSRKRTYLYKLDKAEEIINKFLDMPQINPSGLVNRDGEVWVTRGYIERQFGQLRRFNELLRSVPKIGARARNGKPIDIYRYSTVVKLLNGDKQKDNLDISAGSHRHLKELVGI